MKDYSLRSSNISEYFRINNKKKTGLKVIVTAFSVFCNAIDTNDLLDMHRYLMKKNAI